MTISSTEVKDSAVGGVTTYPFSFRIYADTDLLVYLEDDEYELVLQTLSDDYTVDFDYSAEAESGNVVFNSPVAINNNVWILRSTPEIQSINYENSKKLPASSVETAQDKLTLMIQEVNEKVSRCAKVGLNLGLNDPALPLAAPGELISWNQAGTGFENVPIPVVYSEVQRSFTVTGTPEGNTLADLQLEDNSAAHVHIFAHGLAGGDMKVGDITAILSRTTGATAVAVLSSSIEDSGDYIALEPTGDTVDVAAYSNAAWSVQAIITIRSVDVVTIN